MSKSPLAAIADVIVYESMLFADARSPFRSTLFDQDADENVLLIVGENASGKSLFFRMVSQLAREDHKLLPVTISIRERTGGGLYEMAGMRRAMMFGDESEQSTGATSVNVIANGFKNARRDTPAILMLDEPELGLSDGYAQALGQFLAQETQVAHENYRGLVVVTHNRSLVQGLVTALGRWPLFAHLGSDPKHPRSWLTKPEVRSLEDLMNLREVAGARRKAVHQLLRNPDKGFGNDEDDPK